MTETHFTYIHIWNIFIAFCVYVSNKLNRNYALNNYWYDGYFLLHVVLWNVSVHDDDIYLAAGAHIYRKKERERGEHKKLHIKKKKDGKTI